jgi:hypothetical protein
MTETTNAEIPAQGGPPLADTRDMAQIHQVFRDAIGSAQAYLVGSASPHRAELVGAYYANVLGLLHVHHDGEDELLWPLLIERAPEQADEINRVAGQHADVTTTVAAATARVAEWAAAPSESSASAARAAMATLGSSLLTHLDEEERFIVPLAAQHIYAPEWGQLPAHGMRHFGGDRMWLILGLIREQMRPDQVAAMDAHMPPPVAAMWQGGGEAQFAAFTAELRAG